MKYGCIAEHLGHSFSKAIHKRLADYEYELLELTPDDLDKFMKSKDFLAINVTIPYKQAVIPYLDKIDERARQIGAVNTIVNRSGRLYGYNTDFDGMIALIEKLRIDIEGKKVLVAGTGGTSKTACAVARSLGAREVYKLSRNPSDGSIGYAEAYERHSDAEVLINTTPVGMFPKDEGCPIDIGGFPHVCGIVDAVYNPLRTNLVLDGMERGIKAEGGLYMLVAQAVFASEHFLGKKYPEGTVDRVYREMMMEKENIVLCGMPGCGKSTIGGMLAERLGRKFFDLDAEIVKISGKEITEIFAIGGENYFRDIETEVIASLESESGAVIATGGGAVLRDCNVRMLRRNGRLYFLDRPLEQLMPTPDRPLALSREAMEARYKERLPRYTAVADEILRTDGVAEHTVNEIIKTMRK